jgi:hypothetical protein
MSIWRGHSMGHTTGTRTRGDRAQSGGVRRRAGQLNGVKISTPAAALCEVEREVLDLSRRQDAKFKKRSSGWSLRCLSAVLEVATWGSVVRVCYARLLLP